MAKYFYTSIYIKKCKIIINLTAQLTTVKIFVNEVIKMTTKIVKLNAHPHANAHVKTVECSSTEERMHITGLWSYTTQVFSCG